MGVDERRDRSFEHAVSYLVMDEQAFRRLLDEDGLLRLGALAPPSRRDALTVFAQRNDAVFDVAALRRQASRFFKVKLGLTVDKRYGLRAPDTDAAHVVVAPEGEFGKSPLGTRLCFGRPADDDDLAAAEAAERSQHTSGMALLAARCQTVWLVTSEDAGDRVALTIAAVLASSLLGPILSPSGDELFGVKTARLKLERGERGERGERD
jgi:hypothetical protein